MRTVFSRPETGVLARAVHPQARRRTADYNAYDTSRFRPQDGGVRNLALPMSAKAPARE